jgi:hypothetical protein
MQGSLTRGILGAGGLSIARKIMALESVPMIRSKQHSLGGWLNGYP